MTVDRPFVGGGKLRIKAGTCEACVWGRGPHSCRPYFTAVETGPEPGALYFIAPRRCTVYLSPDGTRACVWEPVEEWARRCAVVTGIAPPERKGEQN